MLGDLTLKYFEEQKDIFARPPDPETKGHVEGKAKSSVVGYDSEG